jgi:hypothetical protein
LLAFFDSAVGSADRATSAIGHFEELFVRGLASERTLAFTEAGLFSLSFSTKLRVNFSLVCNNLIVRIEHYHDDELSGKS